MAEEITGYRLEYMHGGTTVEGYMARPEGAGPWPGVVVIQEWWGLEPHIEDICRRFAKEGFAAIAPDLYHGALTDDPNEAGRLMRQMNMEEAVREIISGAQYLKRQPYCNSLVGVVGFCLGGGLSLLTALRKSGASACVVYLRRQPGPGGAGQKPGVPPPGFVRGGGHGRSSVYSASVGSQAEGVRQGARSPHVSRRPPRPFSARTGRATAKRRRRTHGATPSPSSATSLSNFFEAHAFWAGPAGNPAGPALRPLRSPTGEPRPGIAMAYPYAGRSCWSRPAPWPGRWGRW